MFIEYVSSTNVVILVFLLCLFYILHLQKDNSPKIAGPPSLPIIGNAHMLLGGTRNILETFTNLAEEYYPICKFWLGNRLMFLVSDPEYVQFVLNKSLEKQHDTYQYIETVFGHGLFTSFVPEWKKHRKPIVSTLNLQVLNSFMDVYNKYSKEFIEKLEVERKKGFIDMFPLMTQCTLDIICSSIMGTKMNAMKEESQFIIWMTEVAELAVIRAFNIYLWPNFLWRLSPLSKKTDELDQKIHNYVEKVIKSKRQNSSTTISKKNFLDHLLELTDKEGAWTDDELTNETRGVIMAGSDATALTLSYCLVLLGMYQDIQNKVFEELELVFGDDISRDVTSDDLPKLEYLERFIKETLRVFPVSSYIARDLTQDIVLGKHTLPKGSSAGIPILFIHRSSRFYPDPLKFDPDRFLPEEVAKRHPCTFIPFSFGPRNCIGYRYAMMTMKVVLSTLLRHFRVVDTTHKKILDLKIKFDIATKCDEGYPVRLEPRVNRPSTNKIVW